METKKLIAVIAVVAVMAAAVVIVVISSGSSNNDKEPVVTTGRLWVYGNANNDDYLDSRDVDAINDIINSGTWDPISYPYADTNYDGKVDKDDVTYLEDILKKKSTRMYFTQYWAGEKSVSSIKYPVTGSIGCQYYQAADITTLLGLWNRVTAVESVVTQSYTYKYTDVEKLIPLGALSTMDAETVDKSGISILVAYINSDGTGQQIQKDLKAMGSQCEVIALPIQGMDCLSSVVTMGVLLSAEDASHKYIKYFETIQEYLKTSLSKVSKSDYVSYYQVYNPTNKDKIRIQSAYENGRTTGDLSYSLNIPANYLQPVGENGTWYAYRTQEQFTTMDPECIVISMGSTNTGLTHEQAQAKFEGLAEMFKDCSAYQNKKIFGVSFAVESTFSGMAPLVLLAAQMYPGTVDVDYGWQLLQQWYDDFTNEKVDVKKVGGSVYKLP